MEKKCRNCTEFQYISPLEEIYGMDFGRCKRNGQIQFCEHLCALCNLTKSHIQEKEVAK